jgi:hypothetical protein
MDGHEEIIMANKLRLTLPILAAFLLICIATPGAVLGFNDQTAKAVTSAVGTTNPDNALSHSDRMRALVELGGSLVLDMGTDLDRLSDGSGPDLVVFQFDADGQVVQGCFETRDAEYIVKACT